ncbi:metal ABC transporter ATP-binding protein [Parvibaculum sp.]|uniref:metal ABC transporter ATP-binding protein n=1 Tax=Parvibaculum sp. TaxID=2024848 RepID=UPI00272F749E|nr:metal ABC transporter ATP-binding protein [Parvibaculum sp.]MDP1628923.1 metal ABC transporter ATP-binding protein [Parvibaculum sp.]MDP2148318.1 metal ABC transporter ATP-binding protein [Parvibaculum sp.]MDP3329995.1 metal ABC transporter ATP-binding protein [Parvibaculum sp.]
MRPFALPVPAIRVEDLTVAYERVPAVHHLSGSFAPGSLTAVVGPNGAGKSTLLKAIAGLIPPSEGRIDTGAGARGGIAYLPQLAEIDRSFPISVIDAVSLGLWREIGLFRRLTAGHTERARAALAAVGLDGFEMRQVGSLSAGQLQRALFARLMLQDAGIVLLDEPFAAVDERTSADLMQLVARWHGEGRTVIAVLHDLERVRGSFPQTLLLAREPVAWGETETVLTPDNLHRARYISDGWSDAA